MDYRGESVGGRGERQERKREREKEESAGERGMERAGVVELRDEGRTGGGGI